jgi:hypothetical protein
MPLFPYTAVGACDAIRQEATNLLGENAPMNLTRATGMFDYMTNPLYGGDIEKSVVSPDGATIATMRLLYDQPTRACQVSTDPNTNICTDTTTTVARKQAFVEIDKKITSPARHFTVSDMAVLCDPDKNTFIRTRLLNDLRATRERWDEILLAEGLARRGKIYHFDGTTTNAGANKTLQLLDSNNVNHTDQDIPLPSNFVNFQLDYQKMKFGGSPAIVGEGILHKFMTLEKLACCNAAIPFEDAVAQSGIQYYYDQAGNAVLGSSGIPINANTVLMLVPGALHLLTYQKNNIININTDLEAHTVVTDPVNPSVKWNLDFKWDCSTETWKYSYSTHWTIFNVFQSDSFASDTGTPDCGDDLTGVTGVFGYSVSRG